MTGVMQQTSHPKVGRVFEHLESTTTSSRFLTQILHFSVSSRGSERADAGIHDCFTPVQETAHLSRSTKGEGDGCKHTLQGTLKDIPKQINQINEVGIKEEGSVVEATTQHQIPHRPEAVTTEQEGQSVEERWVKKVQTKQLRLEAEHTAKQESHVTIQHAVFRQSTIVTCGAGIDIQRMACGSECCYMAIKNLPPHTSRSEVEELLARYINRTLFCILRIHHRSKSSEAKTLINTNAAQRAVAALNGSKFSFYRLDVAVTDRAAPNRMRKFDENSKTLTVSWRLPARTIIAGFDTPEAAKNAVTKLHNTIFRGRTIRVGLDTASQDGQPSKIRIDGLPYSITADEVQAHVGAIDIREQTLRTQSPEAIHKTLRQRIIPFGRAQYKITPLKICSLRGEARITFESWENAKRAQESLKRGRLGYLSGFAHLFTTLPPPFQYMMTIPRRQYQAQILSWIALKEKGANKPAYIRTVTGKNHAVIRVLGENKRAVGQLRVRVESLAAGKTLDSIFWHPFFGTTAGRQFLKRVTLQTGADISRDRKSQSLKIYANGVVHQDALNLIRSEIGRLETTEYSICLNPCSGKWLMAGLALLKQELGEGVVTLCVESTPLTLTIRGEEETRRRAHCLLQEMQINDEFNLKNEGQEMCPICLNEVFIPVLMGCGHIYCTSCILHFLSSAHTRNQFPLVCVGNGDRCKTPIAIPIIQALLSAQQFDKLVEAAVTTHIERHPDRFKFCMTPECPQVFYGDEQQKTCTCPSCFVAICIGCGRDAHEEMTCAERTLMDDPDEQERRLEAWARKAGAKQCPGCQVRIQKTEGCDHIICRCGTHICWRCLARFDNTEAAYHHIHVGHAERENQEIELEREMMDREQDEEWVAVNGTECSVMFVGVTSQKLNSSSSTVDSDCNAESMRSVCRDLGFKHFTNRDTMLSFLQSVSKVGLTKALNHSDLILASAPPTRRTLNKRLSLDAGEEHVTPSKRLRISPSPLISDYNTRFKAERRGRVSDPGPGRRRPLPPNIPPSLKRKRGRPSAATAFGPPSSDTQDGDVRSSLSTRRRLSTTRATGAGRPVNYMFIDEGSVRRTQASPRRRTQSMQVRTRPTQKELKTPIHQRSGLRSASGSPKKQAGIVGRRRKDSTIRARKSSGARMIRPRTTRHPIGPQGKLFFDGVDLPPLSRAFAAAKKRTENAIVPGEQDADGEIDGEYEVEHPHPQPGDVPEQPGVDKEEELLREGAADVQMTVDQQNNGGEDELDALIPDDEESLGNSNKENEAPEVFRDANEDRSDVAMQGLNENQSLAAAAVALFGPGAASTVATTTTTTLFVSQTDGNQQDMPPM
ncbi:hypothetical protein AMATHDRAFT_83880 [Amanita thiersii Skay4041]|uniref:RING-type domain-containing protein n=1 Tax=Amanita thiersii Skay4041 TaxID=703135 RepID=A0A2A9NU32_9AGAR|nr:hypothetical protein AMATHDRAFT_83880 [Amanita thiersii Skay4041]